VSHKLALKLSDEAYAELVRISSAEHKTPELIASKILNDLLPDPLLKLAGAVESPAARQKIVGIGKFSSGLPDLGSNKKHMKDFGR
jgi:hypothetical protein